MHHLVLAAAALALPAFAGSSSTADTQVDAWLSPKLSETPLGSGAQNVDAGEGLRSGPSPGVAPSSAPAPGSAPGGGLRDVQLDGGGTLLQGFKPGGAAKSSAVDQEDPQRGGNPDDEKHCSAVSGYCKKQVDGIIAKTSVAGRTFESLASMPEHVGAHGVMRFTAPGQGYSVAFVAGRKGVLESGEDINGFCRVDNWKCAYALSLVWISRQPGGKALCSTGQPIGGDGPAVEWLVRGSKSKSAGSSYSPNWRAGWEYCDLKAEQKYYCNVAPTSLTPETYAAGGCASMLVSPISQAGPW